MKSGCLSAFQLKAGKVKSSTVNRRQSTAALLEIQTLHDLVSGKKADYQRKNQLLFRINN